jgi:hypothetical protein
VKGEDIIVRNCVNLTPKSTQKRQSTAQIAPNVVSRRRNRLNDSTPKKIARTEKTSTNMVIGLTLNSLSPMTKAAKTSNQKIAKNTFFSMEGLT